MRDWNQLFSMFGPIGITKEEFLTRVKESMPVEDYVMVGNILGVTCASDYQGAAQTAGWRFISEGAFAEGKR